MNCEQWEMSIALAVEGDLPEAEAAELRLHLETCAGCRQFAAEMKASQEALHSLAEESLPFLAVRQRVMAQVAPRRRPMGRLWGLAAVAAVIVVMLGVRFAGRQEVPAPPPVRVAVAPPRIDVPPAAPVPPVRQVVRPVRHVNRPAPVPAATEPLVVKMLTPDPDVVIYWLVDTKGEME